MSLQWSSLFGGLGLFLWGMHMLSQGLRLAAGAKLEAVLARATGTRFRGLVSGAVTTALVQSSSAVTVATIGFVNASLLTLGSAIWVLFGANLGTTATGWIVAFAGLKVDFSVLALPLIGAGAVMRLAGERYPLAAWGEALAGFGMLFYGIVLMQSGFADLSANWQIPQVDGLAGMMIQVVVGIAMTVVMQSSSASTAIALTAAQSGLIDITGAAAVVIGANIGTTVTAILASIGATPNAKRVAAAHVLFNLLTAMVAFVVLPWLVPAIVHVLVWFGIDHAPVTTLAIFNTLFNTLGILLIWPVAGLMTIWLQNRFQPDISAGAVPQFLDKTTLPVPGLAVRALASELERIVTLARAAMRQTLPETRDMTVGGDRQLISKNLLQDLKRLRSASETFVEQINRGKIDEATADRLAELLRVRRYLENVIDGEGEVLALRDDLAYLSQIDSQQAGNKALWNAYQQYLDALLALLATPSDVCGVELDQEVGEDQTEADKVQTSEEKPFTESTVELPVTDEMAQSFEQAYQTLKLALLKAGATGTYNLELMGKALQRLSAQHRAVQQLIKAQQWLARASAHLLEST
jgi:phosphate:Na+ symporter